MHFSELLLDFGFLRAKTGMIRYHGSKHRLFKHPREPWRSLGMFLLGLTTGCVEPPASIGHGRDEMPPVTVGRPLASSLASIEGALARNDLALADEGILNLLLSNPDDPRVLELSGDVASRRGDRIAAIAMYRDAIEKQQIPSTELFDKLVRSLMNRGLVFDAIEALDRTIEQHPTSLQPRYDIAGLATMAGVPNVAVSSLRWLATHNQGDPESLLVLSDPNRVQPDDDACVAWLKRSEGDVRLEYCLAKLDAYHLRWEVVKAKLESVLATRPDFIPAYVLYGRALIELGLYDSVVDWEKKKPAGAETSADFLVIAGLWAQHQGQHEQAARAFWDVLRKDEVCYSEMLNSLMLSLQRLGRNADIDFVSGQIVKYSQLRDATKIYLERNSISQSAALEVASAMTSLGRIWEAEAWARHSLSLPNDAVPNARDRYRAIRSQLQVDSPWQLHELTVAGKLDLSHLQTVHWISNRTVGQELLDVRPGNFYFVDEAKERNWVHTCEVGIASADHGIWIYQTVGSGAGVVDYDLDGWPDLTVAASNGEPLESNSLPHCLFRNLNGSFLDVSKFAKYDDSGFSQGFAVGDYNGDGFPDLYDANIGQNRLFRNNGDGTFSDVTREVGLTGKRWTTSVAIVDIDGDSHADLYEASYCHGDAPYSQPCKNSAGIISTCPPLKFESEPDHIWRGSGDGAFQDVSADWINQMDAGRGLGIVVGAIDERPGQDIFVANDMTVNHLWSSDIAIKGSPGNGFKLTDLGAIRGLGFDGGSRSQASMGIATGDVDNDGDLDFLLTHFFDDHNTFYEQVAPGFWSDRSNQVGLSEPSMKMLGFGSQFCDFDNNGTVELMIANGHVDDLKKQDVAFRMPAQLFAREVAGRWRELDRSVLGEYFAKDHLGRALLTLDADRDGRTDVVITHLFEPVALLMNRTENCGNSIVIELKSTTGQRDAIGAVVSGMAGSQKLTSHLITGDGYMCSSQRRIVFGIGMLDELSDIVVHWPNGEEQHIPALACSSDYLVVEGDDVPFLLRQHKER